MLNFVICDDNENALNRFTTMLDLVFVNNDLDGHISLATSDANELFNFIKSTKPDVAILDIDLRSNISGLDLANKIRKINKDIYIIFATAHLEYLILAYKCKTFDYLPKPITIGNLESTILRLFNDIQSNTANKFIKIHNKKTFIKSDSICFIEKENTKLVFRSADTEYTTYSTFKDLEKNLPSNFVRCHKSYIVNVNNIKSIDNDSITFTNNTSLVCYIGKSYKKKFLEVLNYELNTNDNDTK